jgi:hypothetical protein
MLKAIDVQQVVMQMEQTEKVQRVEQQHPDMQQRYLDLQAQAEHKLRQEKVPDAEEARKTLVRDQKEQERRKRERERRARTNLQESARPVIQAAEDQDEAHQGGHINIKV